MLLLSKKIITLSIIFLFSIVSLSYDDTSCTDKITWNSPPSFETDGYVDSSLVKMLEFVRVLERNKIKRKLKLHECLAISFFAEAYRISNEPCSKRSLKYIKEWTEFCSKDRWFDPDASGFTTVCGIFGVNPFISFAPLYFDGLFVKHPECEIGTVVDFRKKINKEDVKKALLFIETPDSVKPKTAIKIPNCEEITHPDLWTKILKLPKRINKAYRAKKIADEATKFAENLGKCAGLLNGKGDALRHCYWTCEMTKKIGDKLAADYSDYHEFSVPNPCDEAIMDYINNRVGIEIGKTNQDCKEACMYSDKLYILEDEGCF